MAIDWARVAERAEELRSQGYDDRQINAVLEQEATAGDRAAQSLGHQNARAAHGDLQRSRGALNAEGAPPGAEPDEDPIERAFRDAEASGAQRGSDQRMAAFVDTLFRAAERGDPRVVHEGTMDRETVERWHQDGHARQIRNREQSGARRR